jgi:hypothetical protein
MSRRWFDHSHVRVPTMPFDAMPRQLSRIFRIGDVAAAVRNRNLDCSEYDKCLVYAVAAGWVNFTCRRCLRFRGESTRQTAVNSQLTQLAI